MTNDRFSVLIQGQPVASTRMPVGLRNGLGRTFCILFLRESKVDTVGRCSSRIGVARPRPLKGGEVCSTLLVTYTVITVVTVLLYEKNTGC